MKNLTTRRSKTAALIIASVASLGTASVASAGLEPPIYVKWDAAGANNGTSWANAYRSLTTALENAEPGQEVWVARGTYVPATVADPLARNRSFGLTSGVRLYGGFAGTEALRSERNPVANRTILSGDVSGNDTPVGGNRADNCFTILWFLNTQSTTIADGFTIRGANLFEEGVVFEDGGAVRITDSTIARVSNCIIIDNDGGSGAAVGITVNPSATAITFANCVIAGNRTDGAAVTVGSSPNTYFSSCTVVGNATLALTEPAAFKFSGSSNASIANSVVWDNFNGLGAGQDAGVSYDNAANLTIAYCNFQGGDPALGPGVITANPCFNDPAGADGVVGTLDDDFTLRPGSRLIDAGDGTRLLFDFTDADNDFDFTESIPVDLARNSRAYDDLGINNTGVLPHTDMGAFEFIGLSCVGDSNGDGLVNTIDLTRFLGNFGQTPGTSCSPFDFNGDGLINTVDLVIFLGKFGNNCNI